MLFKQMKLFATISLKKTKNFLLKDAHIVIRNSAKKQGGKLLPFSVAKL